MLCTAHSAGNRDMVRGALLASASCQLESSQGATLHSARGPLPGRAHSFRRTLAVNSPV